MEGKAGYAALVLLRSEEIAQRMVDGFLSGSSDPVAVLQGQADGTPP